MRLGVKQVLTVVKIVDFGVYLGSDEERVLLPKKQVPEGIEVGDPIEVFLYKESSDRMIATTNEPKLTLGELAVLTVADVGRMGAFLDWGLEKDLFLPFKEQTEKVEKGDKCLVSLYIDKSERLCATMKIYHLLRTDSPYKKDDTVRGTIYEVNREIGAFVAVDNLYSALIPKREMYGRMSAGQEIAVVILLIALATFLILFAFKGPKFKGRVHLFRNLGLLVLCVASIPFITKAAIHSDILSGYFGKLAQLYNDFGIVYSLSASVLDTGMSKPANYTL